MSLCIYIYTCIEYVNISTVSGCEPSKIYQSTMGGNNPRAQNHLVMLVTTAAPKTASECHGQVVWGCTIERVWSS